MGQGIGNYRLRSATVADLFELSHTIDQVFPADQSVGDAVKFLAHHGRGIAITRKDGSLVCCGGVYPYRNNPRIGHAWAIPAARLTIKDWVYALDYARTHVAAEVHVSQYASIEAVTSRCERATRTISWLGFNVECFLDNGHVLWRRWL